MIAPAAETQELKPAEDAELPMPLPQLVAAGRPARSLTREVPLGRVSAGTRNGPVCVLLQYAGDAREAR